MRVRVSTDLAVTDGTGGEDRRIDGWKPDTLHQPKKRNKTANSLSWSILQVSRLLAIFYRREGVPKFDKYRRINNMDAEIQKNNEVAPNR